MGKLRNPIIVFAVLLVSITVIGLALVTYSGLVNQTMETSLNYGSHLSGYTSMPLGGSVNFDVEVISGNTVDVYFLTVDEYVKYINHKPFEAVDGGSFVGSDHAVCHTNVPEGEYRFVVAPHGFASSEVSILLYGGPTILHLVIIPLIALVVASVVAVIMVVRGRRRRKREASAQERLPPDPADGGWTRARGDSVHLKPL